VRTLPVTVAVSLAWLTLFAWNTRAHAQCGDGACVHAGSSPTTVSSTQSQMIDSTMSSLLGSNVDLQQAQHQALSNASVNVNSLLATLQSNGLANSASAALTQPLTVTQLANNIGDTLKASGNLTAANAAYALGAQTTGVSGQQTLTSILAGDKSATSLNQSSLNTLDLLNAVVSTNNVNTARPTQTVNTTGSALGLGANFGAITMSVVAAEPAVFVCGPTGSKFNSAALRLRVHAGLSNAGINLSLNLAAVTITLSALDIIAVVGKASGTIKSINAALSAVSVEATPGVAELYLGTVSDAVFANRNARIDQTTNLNYATIANVSVTLLGQSTTASVDARGYAAGTAPSPTTLAFTGPFPQTRTATAGSSFVTTLLNSLLASLDVRVNAFVGPLALGSLLTSVTNLVVNTLKSTTGLLSTLLGSLLTGAVDPLLAQLGAGLGRVDVTVDRAFAIPQGSACDDGLFCTDNDLCGANNVCSGTPRNCDDDLSCTTHVCDEVNDRCNLTATNGCVINNTCYASGAANPANPCQACTPATSSSAWTNKSLGSSCSDGKYCTVNDTCNLLGVCAGTTRDCNDGLLCTLDTCDETNSKCSNALTIGCAISGACYLPGVNNPQNDCQSCNPATSGTGWTNKASGTSCSDNLFCTVNDQCNSTGSCVSSARDCSDGKTCTLDVCSELLGSCTSTVSGGCMILGQCIGAGVPNPLNPCQECNPALSTLLWSNKATGSSCNDSLFCTQNDSCNGLGLCVGSTRDCSDGLSCTTDVCDELNDRCSVALTTGCVIDGMCVTALADNPANPCQSCNPLLSTSAWSNKGIGTTCNDGLYCTTGDVCDGAGTCSGGPRNCGTGLGCSAGVCNEATDSCGAVEPGCNILGTCHPAGKTNPDNPCLVCDPVKSNVLWSAKPVGTSCSDGLFCTEGDSCSVLGVCLGGAPKVCPSDALSCTLEVCTELTHCDPILQTGCVIDQMCVAAGTPDPSNPCQRCNPLLSTSAWSLLGDNTACSDGLYCTTNDRCLAGLCVGTPRDCGSPFSCATGTCNEVTDACDTAISGCLIGGACYAALQANPANTCQVCDPLRSATSWSSQAQGVVCSDGQYCTVGDACNGSGACTTQPRDCSDALSCTVDVCNETAKACESAPMTACLIGSSCVSANAINPGNDCQRCAPATSTTAWSLAAPGSSCSDGRTCTSSDVCRADGSCAGTLRACDDGLACTSEQCDEATTQCKATVTMGCAIDGACFSDGASDPNNDCRRCDSATSTTSWTNKPAAAACSDGKYCTLDMCNGAGTCVTSPRDCNDNLTCTQDTCNEAAGRCEATVGNACLIGGHCYAANTVKSDNECALCDPGASKDTWTLKAPGSSCTGGMYCLTNRVCDAQGMCSGGVPRSCDDGLPCSTDLCVEATKTCLHTNLAGCVVDGACVLVGTLNPLNLCQVCNPGLSPMSWSPVLSDACQGLEDPDLDGLITSVECPTGITLCPDTDGDFLPDYLDSDDDGDTIFTSFERGTGAQPRDSDGDGKVDYLDADDDGDSLDTRDEQPDPDHNGDPSDAIDTDGDQLRNYLDDDDDDDSIPTKLERDDATRFGGNWDEDGDGSPNWLDTDADGDGHSDFDESEEGGDINGDGVPDYLQADVPADEIDAGVDAGVREDAGMDAGLDAGVDGGLDGGLAGSSGAGAGGAGSGGAGAGGVGPAAGNGGPGGPEMDAGTGWPEMDAGSGGPDPDAGNGGTAGAEGEGGRGGSGGVAAEGGTGGSGGAEGEGGRGGTGGAAAEGGRGGSGGVAAEGGRGGSGGAAAEGGSGGAAADGGRGGSGGAAAEGGSGGAAAQGGGGASGGAAASGGSGGAAAQGGRGGSGGSAANSGSGGRAGAAPSGGRGGSGGAGAAAMGGKGGAGPRAGSGGSGRAGTGGASIFDAGMSPGEEEPQPNDAGAQTLDAGAQTDTDASIDTTPDAGSPPPATQNNASGGSSGCSATPGLSRQGRAVLWTLALLCGLAAVRRRRIRKPLARC
jgi:hypothetical protein